MATETIDLFGGEKSWSDDDWTSSDDRVRGGISQSYMDCSREAVAVFCGNLDIDTLGGAGFASQRTVGDDNHWDLSGYDGIVLKVVDADAKRYTFNVKDDVLPKNPEDGRDQASISWEYDFTMSGDGAKKHPVDVYIAWDSLTPTYRGRERKDADPLKIQRIRRFSVMMRSFFGDQQGPFSLTLKSISAYKLEKKSGKQETRTTTVFPYPYTDDGLPTSLKEKFEEQNSQESRSVFTWLFGACTDCIRLR